MEVFTFVSVTSKFRKGQMDGQLRDQRVSERRAAITQEDSILEQRTGSSTLSRWHPLVYIRHLVGSRIEIESASCYVVDKR
jgi:hypothetical protein